MKKLLIALLATTSALSVVPAHANESGAITGDVDIPKSCTIAPNTDIDLALTSPSEAFGSASADFSQSGDTTWTLDAVQTSTTGSQVVTGAVLVRFPNGDNLGGTGPFDGQNNVSTVVSGTLDSNSDGRLTVEGALYADSAFEGGRNYSLRTTLTCIVQ